jgi:poly-gamma-glutamate capsule biosynthesis protein CapA/YwtB (metallophosphatase superfamily)
VTEDKIRLAVDIAAARKRADIAVCAFHWGISRGHMKIAEYQIELAHHAIDCGADIVFGHHPHVLQGIEVYRGKAIFYSLGNFTFAQHNPAKGHEAEAAIVRCTIDGRRIRTVEYLPTRIDNNIDPHVLSLKEGKDIVEMIAQRSAAFKTRFAPHANAIRLVDACEEMTKGGASIEAMIRRDSAVAQDGSAT